MKRIIATLMMLVLALNFTACATKNENSEDASSKDTTVASDPKKSDVTDKEGSYYIYNGIWAEENIGWENGGFMMDVSVEKEEMKITCRRIQAAPMSRVAEFTSTFKLTDIKDSVVITKYDNDGWGNSGTLEITFNQSSVFCDIKDVVTDSFAAWGMYENTYKLIKDADAYNKLTYTQEEYDEKFGDTEDDSTESGELTTEDIRNNSIMLDWTRLGSDFTDDTTLNPCERGDLLNNPEDYVGQYFVPCETLTEYVVCPDCLGSGYYHGIAEKGKCYNKGYKSMDMTEDGTHYVLQEYPDQATLKAISISKINEDVTGTLVYEYTYPTAYFSDYIYDMREDKSIAITKDTQFIPYMIFLGEMDGVLKFGMIDCDIIW